MNILLHILISIIFSINPSINFEYISPVDEIDFRTLTWNNLENTIIYNHYNQYTQQPTIFIVKNNNVNRLWYYSFILPWKITEIDTWPHYFSILWTMASFNETLFDMTYYRKGNKPDLDAIEYCRENSISGFSYDINEKIINIWTQELYSVSQKLHQDTPDPMDVDPSEFVLCFYGNDEFIHKLSFWWMNEKEKFDLLQGFKLIKQ